jgi:cell surface protein SprA
LNTEDTFDGIRNGILQEGEDVGLDGVIGKDPADYWDVNRNGRRDWGEPASYDDWFYPSGSDQYDTPGGGTINGTETSKNDANEGGGSIRPDTEDINGNGNVDFTNNYFSYSFPLAPDSAVAQRYFQGGNIQGWKLYRIPLTEVKTIVGTPSLSRIEYVRIWLDGFTNAAKPDTISIADISLAGNEWKEIGLGKYEGTVAKYKQDERLEVTVVNTDENQSYRPPDGVEGEFDQIRRLQTKEQSQVLRVKGKGLGKDSIAVAQKTFFQPLNLINYNRVKMFVNGNNLMMGDSVEFFIRFGADTSNFYEFREQVFPGWHAKNVMNLNLLALATLRLDITDTTRYDTTKFRRILSGPIRDYFGLRRDASAALRYDLGIDSTRQSTQEVRIRGNPSLTNIRILMAGIKNVAKSGAYFTGEIWMDELRVTEVKRDQGIAMRARFDLKLADFITLGGEINQRDADFHNVAERFGGGSNQQSYTLGGNVTLDKILPQSLGLSVPVSVNYSSSTATPKYVPGTDIQAINNPRIESIEVDTDGDGKIDQNFSNVIRSTTKQSSVNFSIKRRSQSQNFFIKNTIDNLAASLNFTSSDAKNSQTALARRTAWSGDASYNLTFGSKNFIQPFKWIGKAPLLGKLTGTKLYYTPQNFGAQLQATTSVDKTRTRVLNPQTYRITPGDTTDVSSYTATYNYRTSMKLFENLTGDFSRAFNNDLRAAVKTQRHFLFGLLTDDNELLNMTQSFGLRYTPNLFNWFNPNFSYTSNYRYTNNIQQRSIGRSAGTSTNFTANGTWRFAEMFQFLKRKDPPSGRETPGRTRQAPRTRPEEQQPPNEEGDEVERPGEAQPEQRPERQPPGQPQEKKDKKENQEKEDKQGGGISPLVLLRFFTKFKDVGVNFTRTESFSHIALDSTDTPRFSYMLGFVPRPGVDTVGGFITTPRQYQRGINYSLSSGLDISRAFSLTLRFEHDQRRNEGTSTTGSVSDTWLRTKDLGLSFLPGVEIPFPEWTLTVSGLERINVFGKFASSLSISHGVGGKLTKTWSGNSNNVTNEDFSLNFRPLLKINLSWKNGMVSSFQYNKTTGDRPTYALPDPNNPLQRGQDYHEREQGAQITRNTDISLTTTYSKQSGFRVPLPFLKNKELRNSVDLSLNFLYNVNETAQRSGGNDKEFGGEKTTRWSLSPRMTYSFSNRVRGGAHFEIGQTKSLRSGETKIFELGIDVNISIRGE